MTNEQRVILLKWVEENQETCLACLGSLLDILEESDLTSNVQFEKLDNLFKTLNISPLVDDDGELLGFTPRYISYFDCEKELNDSAEEK